MDNNTIARRDFLKVASLAAVSSLAALAEAPGARLPRKDCFLGMHFDLHPNEKDTFLGRDVTEEMVERFLARVKPDYVQYDCKGHPGYLGYKSEVSTPASGILRDSLAIWRGVTERRGVSLFIHFSGVWDSLAVRQHPEWARLDKDGKPDGRNTSTFSPYVDARMIPQLKEAAERYRLDGAWVDGECWSVQPDYSPAAARAFREKTGIQDLPKGREDAGWQEFLDFHRDRFRQYVRHYVDTIHAARPGFQIASNWLYSTYVPERPSLPVDFVSGDYLGNASISTARLEARYLCQIGKPWDLMAWGFQRSGNDAIGHIFKSAVSLQQEASVVLAQGGGFQAYYTPTRAGKLDDRHIEVMGKVADFCRARQKFCHKTESVPQVGVLFSRNSLYRHSNKLFGGWGGHVNAARGMVDALVECQYSVDVLPDWKLDEAAAAYPLIVVPEWVDIGDTTKRNILQYVDNGGKLLLAGTENAKLFHDALQVRLVGDPRKQAAFLAGEEVMGTARGVWQDVEPQNAKVVETRYPALDGTRDGVPAATLSQRGRGEILAVYGPIGGIFAATHAPEVRKFIGRMANRLFDPMFRVEGPPVIEAALRQKDGRHYLHLCNSAAMQVAADYAGADYIPSVGPIRVLFKAKPKSASLLPAGSELPSEQRGAMWAVTVPVLEIHSAIGFEI